MSKPPFFPDSNTRAGKWLCSQHSSPTTDCQECYSFYRAIAEGLRTPAQEAGDTGNAEADRVLDRLASSDPDFDDCTAAAVLIRKLVVEHKGPEGFATWKDAAIAERLKRSSPAVSEPAEPVCGTLREAVDSIRELTGTLLAPATFDSCLGCGAENVDENHECPTVCRRCGGPLTDLGEGLECNNLAAK
jgi:hypothetical protein